MIGYLKGKIHYTGKDFIIINCNGVGYRVDVGDTALEYEVGTDAEFYIHTHVRENELRLFGFNSAEELSLFEKLIEVSGVGPKAGLTLIRELGVEAIIQAILEKKAAALKVPGVGAKTTNKIILELSDKLKKEGYTVTSGQKQKIQQDEVFNANLDEAIDAFAQLGYKKIDVQRIVEKITINEEVLSMSSEQLVKYILKHM